MIATASTELAGGVTRQLHVSRQRIQQGNGRCIIVEQPEGRLYVSAVDIQGPSRLLYSKKKIPGGANVYVETEATLMVADPQKEKAK